jgi:hypothetical protein
MNNKDIFIMSQREIRRLHIIKKIIDKELLQKDGAEILGLSGRQIRRMVKRVRQEGDGGIIHAARGQDSPRRIKDDFRQKVLKIYRKKYWDFGATLAQEKLQVREKIRISKETLRKWLLSEGLKQPQRRRKKHRQRRERKKCYGQMVQVDGSHHDWLGIGHEIVLMGYIDDATSNVHGVFYTYEGVIPAMESLERYIRKNGKPQSVYVDKHSTYRSQDRDRWKALTFGEECLSQFERGCRELEITVIHAHSPQAKGRVERLFRTLQDRLVKELRLQGAKTVEQANQVLETYLKEHNARFSVEPALKTNVHQRVAMKKVKEALSRKIKRRVRNDFTIAHDKALYQIKQYTPDINVEVRERINGYMEIWDRRKRLKFRKIASPKKRTLSLC